MSVQRRQRRDRNRARLAGLSWWEAVTLIVREMQAAYRKHHTFTRG